MKMAVALVMITMMLILAVMVMITLIISITTFFVGNIVEYADASIYIHLH